MALLIVAFVLVGITFPDTFSPINHYTMPLFAFMTFANSLGGGFREMADVVRHPLPVVVIFAILHAAMPLLALAAGELLFPEAPLFTTGLVLANATGCAPFLRDITPTLVKLICAVFALCLLGFFLGWRAAQLLKVDFPTAVTMSLNSGIRNIAAGSVLAIAYFPEDVLFPVAFSPLFLQATTAVIVKILHTTKAGKAFRQQAELPE